MTGTRYLTLVVVLLIAAAIGVLAAVASMGSASGEFQSRPTFIYSTPDNCVTCHG